jgi:hypothetical protein
VPETCLRHDVTTLPVKGRVVKTSASTRTENTLDRRHITTMTMA